MTETTASSPANPLAPAAPPVIAPALTYATDLALHGISYEVKGPLARIFIAPPERSLRNRLIGAAALMAYALISSTVSLVRSTLENGQLEVLDVAWFLVLVVVIGIATHMSIKRWRRAVRLQTVLELTEHYLILRDHDSDFEPRTRQWDRRSIGGIIAGPVPWNAGALNGHGLHIKITGKTIAEVLPGQQPSVARWIAERLNDALHAPLDAAQLAGDGKAGQAG